MKLFYRGKDKGFFEVMEGCGAWGEVFCGGKGTIFFELWSNGIMENAVMRLCGHRGLNLLAVYEDGYPAGA